MSSFLDTELEKAHGGLPVVIGPGVATYPDGGCRKTGVFEQPSNDPRHRLMAQRRYHNTLLQRAESDAEKLQAALYRGAEPWKWPITNDWALAHYGKDPGDAGKALARLREIVKQERAEVAALDAQLGPTIYGVG